SGEGLALEFVRVIRTEPMSRARSIAAAKFGRILSAHSLRENRNAGLAFRCQPAAPRRIAAVRTAARRAMGSSAPQEITRTSVRRPTMRRAPIDHQGFTILELVCTLGILSVLFAIALPGISAALPGLLVDQAARRLVSELELARVKAVNRDTRV